MYKKKSFMWWMDLSFLILKHPVLFARRISYNIARFKSDIRARFNFYPYPHKIIFLVGIAIGGTTWIKKMLSPIPGYYTRAGWSNMPFEIAYNQDICEVAFSDIPKNGYTLFKTHLNPKKENIDILFNNGVEKVIIMYRDLRDVAVSRYYREVDDPKPQYAHDYVDYNALGKKEGMNHSIEFVGTFWVSWIKDWLEIARKEPDKYILVSYEDLKKNTKKVFKDILSFYSIELDEELIDTIIENAEGKGKLKKNIEAARILPFAISSNFRSGKSGHWREELTPEQIEKCKHYMGNILIELGYEKDLNW